MDPHSLTIQNAKLTRTRSYNDTLQHLDVKPPKDAPQWCCIEVEQVNDDVTYDTDIGYDSSIYDEYMYDIDVTMEEMEENRQQE